MVMESMVIKIAAEITLVLLTLAVLLAFIRLFAGPSQADRIVALDLISVLIVAVLAALSIYRQQKAFLDVAIAYALIAFLGTVALARFRERLARTGGIDENQEEIDK
ncbi:multicomponent Na+:H+ antiporter subunit F [Desulfosalsimonas propionicica]|uniref:Multicomponent Na+:H+ antiporter subunit F n=1 Tax=Desulfosalsimonas propionicica TaxID=332175 RepID=A0A7W0CBZ8_9BACT|nr:monovalent cation/H+ antiporter complex subunit F [Desulfosalsimonas propionicica]MBA2882944.1 multicomponent Na+:H+ antiporter subunit F [Desulfosalsimonas propionicica]